MAKLRRISPMIWAALYALLLPLILGIAVLADGGRRVVNDQGAAAWVQAVGSLFALAIAVALPEWHAARARARNEQAAKVIARLAVEQVIAMGYAFLDEVDEPLGRNTTLRATTEALMSFPFDRLENAAALAAFVELRAVVPKGGETLQEIFGETYGDDPPHPPSEEQEQRVRVALADCKDAWARLENALGI